MSAPPPRDGPAVPRAGDPVRREGEAAEDDRSRSARQLAAGFDPTREACLVDRLNGPAPLRSASGR